MRHPSARAIQSPVFFIGMPRSGTTVTFEAFAAHENVGWFSQHLEWKPNLLGIASLARAADWTASMRRSVTRSDESQSWRDRLRVGPSEAYNVWQRCCGEKFRYSYLLGAQASSDEVDCVRATVASVLRYQGKARFAAKLTGPGRIAYLLSVFPDARFVHIVRDGRAVVQSLMRVQFWKDRGRMFEPAWRDGLTPADYTDWERYGRSPLALAAVQWRRVLESTRDEARLTSGRYAEFHYEAFTQDAATVLSDVLSFCELPQSNRAQEFLKTRFDLKDMNYQWRNAFDAGEVSMVNELLERTLVDFGYQVA